MKLLLFENIHRLMQSEKILTGGDVPRSIEPVPKQYSTECGMCLALQEQHLPGGTKLLEEAGIRFEIVERPQ